MISLLWYVQESHLLSHHLKISNVVEPIEICLSKSKVSDAVSG